MIRKNIKTIKKISYYGLTLFSTVLTLAAPAAESFSKDFLDRPVKGGTVRVPQQPESPFDFLEKWIEMPWDCNTKEDEVQGDLKFPPMDDHQQRYRELHNSIIDKYSSRNPNLVRHKLPSKQEPRASTLLSSTKEFRSRAEELRKAKKAENQKYQEAEKTLTNGFFYGAKAVIDNTVEDTEAKNFFLGLLDYAKEQISGLYRVVV